MSVVYPTETEMVIAKVFKLVKSFDGLPKSTDFELIEEELPAIKDGEFLAEAVYLSVDPYMRAYSRRIPLGSTMMGMQVARITESKNQNFPVGEYLIGVFGWRSHTVSDGVTCPKNDIDKLYLLPELGDLPPSLALGVLGMPGNTAYFGFLEICQPKCGETVVVSGAAGAVGSLVGQIAKIKGCKVIGIAGSDEKGQWLINELGFDHFINYKTGDIDKELSEKAPKGVDCYFDNVGGAISATVLNHMNLYGRISLCGIISKYNEKEMRDGYDLFQILFKQLKVEGFIVTRWNDRWMEGIQHMTKWVKEGKVKYRETVTDGFEKMVDAFVDMLNGGNTVKPRGKYQRSVDVCGMSTETEMVTAKIFKLVKYFEGLPKSTDFELIEEELPEIKDGEFLAEAVYLSVDPYMRSYCTRNPIGATMMGTQVARITESKNPNFPVGGYLYGFFGWRSHTISDGKISCPKDAFQKLYLLPNLGNLSPSLSLGVLGMPGNAAYFGFLEICQPKYEETVVVSGAAGAVGSLAGQIAKIKGCMVIGIAGTDEKGEWLIEELGFDHFINYKTGDIDKELSEKAPKGIDCYFDNVGGVFSATVLKHMNSFGRISICGQISKYSYTEKRGGYDPSEILLKQLKVEGFIVTRWSDRWMEGINQMTNWVKEGKVKYRENVTTGFEKMVDAFVDMLNGGNTGKAIVKV
ncbi:hypothetical protein JTB14_018339 [Gonioctena quinquepunctata]|nr:hypothetical protein JTB14_018339 [Gonioctena quinquepunctata]